MAILDLTDDDEEEQSPKAPEQPSDLILDLDGIPEKTGDYSDQGGDGSDDEGESSLHREDADDTVQFEETTESIEFLPVKLPCKEEIDKALGPKAKVIIGEFAIVVNRLEFTLYVYEKKRCNRGKFQGKVIEKFRLLGHYRSIHNALRGIQWHIAQVAFSHANHRHLGAALQYLERRDAALLSSLVNLKMGDFTPGTVLRSNSLLYTSPEMVTSQEEDSPSDDEVIED